MADLNFPSNPQIGDTYTIGNRTWVWNGSGWAIQTSITSLNPFTAVRAIISTSTVATTTGTGALQVVGGVGIGGNLVVGGGAVTRNIINANAYSSGVFSAPGDAQSRTFILRKELNSTSTTALTTNGSIAGVDNQVILPNYSTFVFKAMITARAVGTNNEAGWELNGVVTRNASAGTTAIQVVNKTKIWSSNLGYDVNVGVDLSLGALQVLANIPDNNPVRFVAKVETVEVISE